MLVFIIIILVLGLSGLLIYFLCRFAGIYRTQPSGERIFIGYVWKWSRTYIIYDGIPFLGADRIGFINPQMRVYLKTENSQHNYVEIDYGSVNDQGEISDISNNIVARCDSIGQGSRSSCITNGCQDEIAFAKTGFRKGDDLLLRAAAVGALCSLNADQDKALRADVRIGFRDLALPSALIFMLIYIPLAFFGYLEHDSRIMRFLGNEWSFIAYMMMSYGAICWLLYFIKKCMTMRNRSMAHILGLIDRNVGVNVWNIVIILLASILSVTTICVSNYTLAPLFLVITVGFVVNMGCFKEDWKIYDPCASWGNKWGRSSNSGRQRIQQMPGRIEKVYSWAKVLEDRGISHNNEEVVLTFNESEYVSGQGRVRTVNPFAGNQGLTFEQLKDYAHKVLEGCDGPDNEEKNAIITIINSAYQICQRYNLADFELYELVLMFCQYNIEYTPDEDCDSIGKTKEYFRFAAETLFDGQGDCDCKAVLAFMIFKALNVDAELALVRNNNSNDYSHVAVVLHKDSTALVPISSTYHEYSAGLVFCETTAAGYKPGDIPSNTDIASIYLLK